VSDPNAFLVRRTVPLAEAPAAPEASLNALRAIEPIVEASVAGRTLRLRYDASCVGFADIERLLGEAGIVPARGLAWRWRSAWYRFLDANARSNAQSGGGACCSRPPSPWRRDSPP
jgi:hypothetical protein